MSDQSSVISVTTTSVVLTHTFNKLAVKLSGDVANHLVAFHLFHNQTRVETTNYSKKIYFEFRYVLQRGSHFCIAYLKNSNNGEVTRIRSNGLFIREDKTKESNEIFEGIGPTDYRKKRPLTDIAYFSPITAGSYADFRKNGFKARANYPAIKISSPVRFDKITDLNVEYMMNGWRFLNPLWKQYILTHDEALLVEIIGYIRDWNLYRIRSKRNVAVWNDMVTGIRAIHLALLTYIVSCHSINLTEQQKILIRKLQNVHLHKLSQPGWIKLSNHGIWQLLGLRLLCWALHDEPKDAIEICIKRAKELLDFTFDEEGVNTENSPFYHGYSANLFDNLPKNLFKESAAHISTIKENAHVISAWLTDPLGFLYIIGDTAGRGVAFPDDYLFENRKKIKNDEFIYKFYRQGYAIIRTLPGKNNDESHSLVFHGTNRNVTHAHADKLGFILFHKGIEIFTDSGKYIYEYGVWQDYFVSDKAHNVLGITGRIFGFREPSLSETKLDSIRTSNSEFTLSGRTQYRDNQFGYKRTLKYRPGEQLTIMDEVLIEPTSTLEQRFHLGIGISAEVDANNRVLLMKDSEQIGYLQTMPGVINIDILCGSESPITGWSSKAYKHKHPIDTIILTFAQNTPYIYTNVYFQ